MILKKGGGRNKFENLCCKRIFVCYKPYFLSQNIINFNTNSKPVQCFVYNFSQFSKKKVANLYILCKYDISCLDMFLSVFKVEIWSTLRLLNEKFLDFLVVYLEQSWEFCSFDKPVVQTVKNFITIVYSTRFLWSLFYCHKNVFIE